MLNKNVDQAGLAFPFGAAPSGDQIVEVAPGIHWFRLSLPFQLNHVNIYLVADGAGYVLIDTGLGNRRTLEIWRGLLAGALKSFPISRIIVTHFHPDHVGAVGWLAKELQVPVYMPTTEYLMAQITNLDPGAMEQPHYRSFYLENGLAQETVDSVVTKGHEYLRLVSGLPHTYRRLIAGDTLKIGSRHFEVLTGGGHSPEQAMLLSRDDQIFLAADQVLAQITPNVSVHATDPTGDPLGIYIRSLRDLQRLVPQNALVLPGHQLPFNGIATRVEQLIAHHHARCAEMAAAAREKPCSTADFIKVVFKRPLDPHQIGFAFAEILAHVNFMLRANQLQDAGRKSGVMLYSA